MKMNVPCSRECLRSDAPRDAHTPSGDDWGDGPDVSDEEDSDNESSLPDAGKGKGKETDLRRYQEK